MEELVMSHREILDACEDIGAKLKERLSRAKGVPVCVCVMKGAVNFMVDLMEAIEADMLTDYIQVSSYEGGTSTTGKITLKKDVTHRIKGRTIILVEDVVDTGITMDFLVKHFEEMGAAEVIVVTLFDKVASRKVPVKIDYSGKVLESNKFLVGYGLDYRGLLRNVPFVYVPSKDELEAWDRFIAQE
ncbi:MAG: hypoxanthine phosphoribosyltransferase [Bacilli bacterium]|nr:hypoxanthine phosphoribosyltransferase [Bacilli bacterium]